MSAVETADLEGLPQYREIDPLVAVGAIPLAQCVELQAEIGDIANLPPEAQYDLAWLRLETLLGMTTDTDRGFPKQEIIAATSQTKGGFKAVMGNEQAPAGLRAQARLALSSMASYQEAL